MIDEPFGLTVLHRGKEKEVEAKLQRYGYVYRFRVEVEGVEVYFEKDEEGKLPGDTAAGNGSKGYCGLRC